MPIVSEHKEARLRRLIRDALAFDPIISLNGLRDVIQQKINAPVDLDYLRKLVKKVMGEVAVNADREKVEARIAQSRENNRILREALLKIAFPGPNTFTKDSDKLRALELIAKIDHSMANIEKSFGLFNKNPGEIEEDKRLKPIEPEVLDNIVKAFENWGVAPPEMRKIEPQRIVNVESKNVPNEPTNKQPNSAPAASPAKIIPAVESTMVPLG